VTESGNQVLDVSYGSFASHSRCSCNVRFSANSGHFAVSQQTTFRAISVTSHCKKCWESDRDVGMGACSLSRRTGLFLLPEVATSFRRVLVRPASFRTINDLYSFDFSFFSLLASRERKRFSKRR
jgi:hypothetical protein